jgi:uncharacterized protein (TIGR04255 family)
LRRPFKTPLFEVSLQLDLAPMELLEFRARTFYEPFRGELIQIQRFPLFLVPPEQLVLPTYPPAYRFSNADGTQIVSLGPRMIAINKRGWSAGWPGFREFVERTVRRYLEIMENPLIEQFSLGFYNRVPVADIEELTEIFAIPLELREGASLGEFFHQQAVETGVGSVLSQMISMRPDDFSRETFIAANNIVRNKPIPPTTLDIDTFLRWTDDAHQIARDLIRRTLTVEANRSWDETHASESAKAN